MTPRTLYLYLRDATVFCERRRWVPRVVTNVVRNAMWKAWEAASFRGRGGDA